MFNRRYLRIKVMQSLYSKLLNSDSIDSTLKKQLQNRVFDAWKLYIIQLHTIARVCAEAEIYHENQLNRHIKVMNEELVSLKILRNKFVSGTLDSNSFNNILDENNLRNIIPNETIKLLFQQLLKKEYFINYNNPNEEKNDSEYRIIHNIFKKLLLKSDLFISNIEENFIGWTDDAQLVIKAINKTIKSFFEKGEVSLTNVMPPINWNETNEYLSEFYLKVVAEDDELETLIDPILKNWDPNRLNVTDHLLLKMAVTEFLYFPSIPVKVTINEYIEISKLYSTPKSKDFINGVLDKLLKQLQKEKRIKKIGRGLIN